MIKVKKDELLANFLVAVEHLTNYKAPQQLLRHSSIKDAFLWFPIVGLLVGFVTTLISFTLFSIFEQPLVLMAVVSGLIYSSLVYYLERDHGINALVKVVKFLPRINTDNELLLLLNEHKATVVLSLSVLCKVGISSILVYQGLHWWLILPSVLSAAIIGYFAGSSKKAELGLTKLKSEWPLIIAFVISVLIGKVAGFAIAAIISYFIVKTFNLIFKQQEKVQFIYLIALTELVSCGTLIGSVLLYFT